MTVNSNSKMTASKPKKHVLESTLKKRVLSYLKTAGGLWRSEPRGPHSVAGVADIVGCYKGLYVEIELKAPGKYPTAWDGLSAIQWTHSAAVVANEGYYFAIDSIEGAQAVIAVLVSRTNVAEPQQPQSPQQTIRSLSHPTRPWESRA